MIKISWLAVARSPYNDYLFNELANKYDLKVYYRYKKLDSHPWSLVKTKYIFDYIKDNYFLSIKNILSSNFIVISGWGYWRYIIIMFLLSKKHRKVYWTDTPNTSIKFWSGIKGYIRKLISKYVFNKFDEIWSTGIMGTESLKKLGCESKKIKSFPFFYDLRRFENINEDKRNRALEFRNKHSTYENEIIFLCMGQLIDWKRFDDVLKALHDINETNVTLWIAGTGPDEKKLKLLTESLKLNKNVYFLGWLQQDEVDSAFIAADVFVHPADNDPFPTVVLDAMTWGKPIIGSNTAGSVVDRVNHGTNGFVYEVGDIKNLSEYMRFFIKNNAQIIEFSKRSRETACRYPVSLAFNLIDNLLINKN